MYKSHSKTIGSSKAGPIEELWNKWDGERSILKEKWEKFSYWTLPHLYPSASDTDVSNYELHPAGDNLGADAVNHLSQHIVDTLFTQWRPFFRIHINDKVKNNLISNGMPEVELERTLGDKEREAMFLNTDKGFKAEAPTAAKLLVTLGNALVYYPSKNGKVQVYNPRDYVIKRDIEGTPMCIITRNTKAINGFNDEIIEKIRYRSSFDRDLSDEQLTLFTKIELQANGKYMVSQEVEGVELDVGQNTYSAADLPWIPLTWNLLQGEDWGRGLVEEKARAFNTLAVLTEAEAQIVANAAEVKFLVDPSSYIDVKEIMNAASGTYHVGAKDDVSVIQIDKHADLAQIGNLIERYRREIMSTFIMEEAVRRDAERVTAQEIRYMASRLENKYGGVYSRLAYSWQRPIAYILLSSLDFNIAGMEDIKPRIITGMESLSRTTEMDNISMVFQDLAQVNSLPEEMRQELAFSRLIHKSATNRGVDPYDLILTPEEKQQRLQQQMQMQQQMQQQEAQQQVQVNAANQMMK